MSFQNYSLSLPCSLVKFSIFVTVKLKLLSALVPGCGKMSSKVPPLTNSGTTGILSKIQN